MIIVDYYLERSCDRRLLNFSSYIVYMMSISKDCVFYFPSLINLKYLVLSTNVAEKSSSAVIPIVKNYVVLSH